MHVQPPTKELLTIRLCDCFFGIFFVHVIQESVELAVSLLYIRALAQGAILAKVVLEGSFGDTGIQICYVDCERLRIVLVTAILVELATRLPAVVLVLTWSLCLHRWDSK